MITWECLPIAQQALETLYSFPPKVYKGALVALFTLFTLTTAHSNIAPCFRPSVCDDSCPRLFLSILTAPTVAAFKSDRLFTPLSERARLKRDFFRPILADVACSSAVSLPQSLPCTSSIASTGVENLRRRFAVGTLVFAALARNLEAARCRRP